jgi:hypothetical protein
MLIIFNKDRLFNKMQSAKKEWEGTNKAKFTDLEWAKENLKVLSQNHVYYRLCYYKLAVSKRKNIKVIEQEILNMENDFNNPQEAIKKKKRKKKESYERKARAWS